MLANLGYYAQFKYKVSFNGSISTDELIAQRMDKYSKMGEYKE